MSFAGTFMNGLYSASPDDEEFVKERVERHFEIKGMAKWGREVYGVPRYVLYFNSI